MKITALLPLMLIIVLVPNPGHAKFYKFKDASGVWRYVDDLNAVPEDQRSNVVTYKEKDDNLTPAQLIKKRKLEESAQMKAEKDSGSTSLKKKKPIYSSKQRAKLEKKKAILEQEKVLLVKEQQALLKFNTKLADEVRLNAHKRLVHKLNKRIQAYEKKRQHFELEVAAFNSE